MRFLSPSSFLLLFFCSKLSRPRRWTSAQKSFDGSSTSMVLFLFRRLKLCTLWRSSPSVRLPQYWESLYPLMCIRFSLPSIISFIFVFFFVERLCYGRMGAFATSKNRRCNASLEIAGVFQYLRGSPNIFREKDCCEAVSYQVIGRKCVFAVRNWNFSSILWLAVRCTELVNSYREKALKNYKRGTHPFLRFVYTVIALLKVRNWSLCIKIVATKHRTHN